MFDFGLYTQVSKSGPHGPLVAKMSGRYQGILEFQIKFRFSNKKKKRRELLKMARAVFFTVWVMLNYSDSFQILLSERKLKGLAPFASSAAFCS